MNRVPTIGIVTLEIPALDLKEFIDKRINLSNEVSNWSVAYDIIRYFPGLQDAEDIVKFYLNKISPDISEEEKANGKVKAEIDADDIIAVVQRTYKAIAMGD